MSSAESYIAQLLTNLPIYLDQYITPILYIIGNLGNFLTIFILLKKSWRKNVCVLYFLVCLVSNTIFMSTTLLGSIFTSGFQINLSNSNISICKLFYYISYVTSVYYPIILILASIDRLLISSQNVDTRLYSSRRLAYFMISINTALVPLFSLHLLIKVHIQELYPSVFICYYDLSSSYINFFIYSSLVISGLIPLVLIILSILSFKNVHHIQSIPPQQRQNIRSMRKKDFQLLRCLYVHNIIYIICSILIVIGIGYSMTIDYETSTTMEIAVDNFLNNFGAFIHYFPYFTSFFIFMCVSKAFRLEVKRIIFKLCHKDLTAVREEENNQHELVNDNIELRDVISTIHPNTS